VVASICAITSSAILGSQPVARADDLPNLSRVIVCKLIKDDLERLHCYDRALSEAPAGAPSQGVPDPSNAARSIEGNWQVSEGKSPTDGTPILTAVLEALGGRAALVLRCQHQRTEVYITVQSYVGAAQPLPVTYTINDGPPIETRWLPAQEGNALFVPTPTVAIDFVRALPEQGTLSVTVHDFIGRGQQLQYKLGPMTELRNKIAASCQWPSSGPVAGATPPLPAAPPSGKLIYIPPSQHRWNVSARHPYQ
jgi:Type VI secretion system VasI, EvfG, VC_A0118